MRTIRYGEKGTVVTARLERIAQQVEALLGTPLTAEQQAQARSIFAEISAALAGGAAVDQAETRLAMLLRRRRLSGQANPAMDARQAQQINAPLLEVGHVLISDLRKPGTADGAKDDAPRTGRDDE